MAKAAAVTLADRGARSGQYFPHGERGGVCSGLVIPPLGPLQHNEIIRDTQLHRLTNTSISYSIYAEPCRGLSGRRWNGKTDVGRKGHGKVVQCQAPLSIRRRCVSPHAAGDVRFTAAELSRCASEVAVHGMDRSGNIGYDVGRVTRVVDKSRAIIIHATSHTGHEQLDRRVGCGVAMHGARSYRVFQTAVLC